MRAHAYILRIVVKTFGFDIDVQKSPQKRWQVWGYYSPELTRRDLWLVFSCKDWNEPHKLTERNVNKFLFQINTTMQHELLHRSQWLYRDIDLHDSKSLIRGKASNKQKTYLGNYDEIEAQAHDAAMEIRFYYPQMKPEKVLQNYFTDPKISIPTFNSYTRAFGRDYSNPVWRRLIKKTCQWLPYTAVKHTSRKTHV